MRAARHRTRRVIVAVAAIVATLAPVAAAQPASTVGALVGPDRGGAHIDPELLGTVAAGPAPAVLSFDAEVTTHDAVAAHLRRHGVRHSMLSMLPMALVCAETAAQVVDLAAAPGAISVWGDEPMVPTLAWSVPTIFNGDPGSIRNALGVTGDGVGIAVLDTGIDATHPDLEYGRRTVVNARVIVSHYEILGVGEDTCVPDVYQEDLPDSETVSGHGTHLAGVAAGDGTASSGNLVGVAPGADLVGVNIAEQVTPQVDGDVKLSLIRFIGGVNYVLNETLVNGPTVTKVALLGWTSAGLYDPWHPHTLAVRDLHDFGVTVVAPTGNGGPGPSRCDEAATCSFNRLAVGPYVVAVGATPKTSRTVLEDYSSRGDPELRSSRGEPVFYEPTVVAPGTNVFAARRPGLATFAPPVPGPYPLAGGGAGVDDQPTSTEYQSLTGTSVAAAHVAGTVALMQEAALDATGCFLGPWQVREILQQTASAMTGYGRWEVGAGAVDATAAIQAARSAGTPQSRDPWNCPR